MKKILFVTGKWPYKSKINDGGDAVVSEIAEAIGTHCQLTLLVVKNDIDTSVQIPDVHSVIQFNEDVSCFHNLNNDKDSKFLKWIRIGNAIADYLRKAEREYDTIIIHHMLFGIGLTNNDQNILRKSILMPMFTGYSYKLAGENVPGAYLESERNILPQFSRILTPSEYERDILFREYHVSGNRISIIPRPIKYPFQVKQIKNTENVKLIYIASVRKQKNHVGAVKMMLHLTKSFPDIMLLCCGAIQEQSIYTECQSMIREYGLERNIKFLGNHSHEELGKIISICDFNISVSKCETFGRGIYEGMAAGMPTFVLNYLDCIKKVNVISVSPVIASDEADMADKIAAYIKNPQKYQQENEKGQILQEELSSQKINKLVQQAILKEDLT